MVATRPSSGPSVKYTSGLLARNSAYSLVGQLLPLPVAVVAIPYIISGVGIDRFGVLTIAWIVVGYFGLFDMGIGRATTKFVAEYAARGESRQLRDIVLSSFLLLCLFGVIAGTLLAVLSGWLVNEVLNVSDSLVEEARQSFYLLSLSIPVVLLIAGARGVLEAQQQFRIINFIKVPSAVAVYILPLLVLPFSTSLVPIVSLLVVSKMISLLCYLHYGWRCLPESQSRPIVRKRFLVELLRFGGWLGVTNFISPLIGFADRFFIGSILTMSAVAYYSTPYDVIVRLFLIPGSILVVVFPAFSAYYVNDASNFMKLYQSTVKYILLAMAPIVVVIIAFAQPLLQVWLGHEFARNSSLVVQILASGVLFSSAARVPLNTTQAIGRPDIAAKFYMIELPIVVLALYFLTGPLGIVGVAVVWLARIVIEAVVLFYYGNKILRVASIDKALNLGGMFSLIVSVCLLGWVLSTVSDLVVRALATFILLVIGYYIAYVYFLDESEKHKILGGLQKVWKKLFQSQRNKPS